MSPFSFQILLFLLLGPTLGFSRGSYITRVNQNVLIHGLLMPSKHVSVEQDAPSADDPAAVCLEITLHIEHFSKVETSTCISVGKGTPYMARVELPTQCKPSNSANPCGPPFLAYMEVTRQGSTQHNWSRMLHISGYAHHLDIDLEEETQQKAQSQFQPPRYPHPWSVMGPPSSSLSAQSDAMSADSMPQTEPCAQPPAASPIPFGAAVRERRGEERYCMSPSTLTAMTSCLQDQTPCSRTELLTSPYVPYYLHFTTMDKPMCSLASPPAEDQPSGNGLPQTHQEIPTHFSVSMRSLALVICAFLSGMGCTLAAGALSPSCNQTVPQAPPKVDVACWQTPRLELGQDIQLSAMATHAGWQSEAQRYTTPVKTNFSTGGVRQPESFPGWQQAIGTRWERTGLRLEKRFSVEE